MSNKNDKNEIFKNLLLGLNLSDFLGIASILGVEIKNLDNSSRRIRNDFAKIEEEIIEKYKNLTKQEKNKFLKRLRQIVKSNKIHKE